MGEKVDQTLNVLLDRRLLKYRPPSHDRQNLINARMILACHDKNRTANIYYWQYYSIKSHYNIYITANHICCWLYVFD